MYSSIKGDVIRCWYCTGVRGCVICGRCDKCKAQMGSGGSQELSARLVCIFDQSECSAEANPCKIINLDHQSSLRCIAVLPEPVKCNTHAVINFKYLTETKVSLYRKGQDLAASYLRAWRKPPPCQDTNPVTRQISQLLWTSWFHKKQTCMRFMASAKAAAIETHRPRSVPTCPSGAFVLLKAFRKYGLEPKTDPRVPAVESA